jgi:hypothetical protein
MRFGGGRESDVPHFLLRDQQKTVFTRGGPQTLQSIFLPPWSI